MDDNNGGKTEVPIPLVLRTHEKQQLQEFLEIIVAEYLEHATEANNYKQRAETLKPIKQKVQELDGDRLFLSASDWETLLWSLTRLEPESNRVWWLQKKLYNQLREKIEELQ